MKNRKKYDRKEPYNNKSAAVVSLSVVLVLAGIIAACFFLPAEEKPVPSPNSQQTDTPEVNSSMEPDAELTAFYPSDYYADGISEDSMAYMVNGEIIVEPEETRLPLYLEFPNVNTAYLQFELINTETEESLYQSKYMSPGSLLREISISHPLSSGKTKLTLLLSALDPESLEVVGTAQEHIFVTVKNS